MFKNTIKTTISLNDYIYYQLLLIILTPCHLKNKSVWTFQFSAQLAVEMLFLLSKFVF